MPKVFISHSWKDNDIARTLYKYLINDRVKIWFDSRLTEGSD